MRGHHMWGLQLDTLCAGPPRRGRRARGRHCAEPPLGVRPRARPIDRERWFYHGFYTESTGFVSCVAVRCDSCTAGCVTLFCARGSSSVRNMGLPCFSR